MAPFVEEIAVGRSLLLKMSAIARSSISSPASTQLFVGVQLCGNEHRSSVDRFGKPPRDVVSGLYLREWMLRER